MPWGGRRANAGRKTDKEREEVEALIDGAVGEDKWRAIIGKLADLAEAGNVKAAELLLSFRFGRPAVRIGGAEGLPPIIVERVRAVAPRH